jgi:hypothetical protein
VLRVQLTQLGSNSLAGHNSTRPCLQSNNQVNVLLEVHLQKNMKTFSFNFESMPVYLKNFRLNDYEVVLTNLSSVNFEPYYRIDKSVLAGEECD